MGQSLKDIAQKLQDTDKKVQLIYAFNGVGKTRLSREFKNLVESKVEEDSERFYTTMPLLRICFIGIMMREN